MVTADARSARANVAMVQWGGRIARVIINGGAVQYFDA